MEMLVDTDGRRTFGAVDPSAETRQGPRMRDDELLDIRQAADFLKVSEASLRRWTNSGRLACLRVGRRRERRFRRSDLLAFAEHEPSGGLRAGPAMKMAGGHLVGVHGSDAGCTDLAASFLGEAFRHGCATYLVAGPEMHRAVSRRLCERYPVAKSRIEEGELAALEFVGSVEGQLDELEARFDTALRRGAESICVVGDVLGVKRAVQMEGLIEYEARYDRIAHEYPVVTLCLYDTRGFTASDLMGALKLHPDTFRHPTERLFA